MNLSRFQVKILQFVFFFNQVLYPICFLILTYLSINLDGHNTKKRNQGFGYLHGLIFSILSLETQ